MGGGGGELATSEELVVGVSPRGEVLTGWAPCALCESALAPKSSVLWEWSSLCRLPSGVLAAEGGVPWIRTGQEPPILLGWILYGPSLGGMEQIEPNIGLLVVVPGICDVVASSYVSR